MRFLLLFVSFLFTFIFYVFYTLGESKGIFGGIIENGYKIKTLIPEPFSILYSSLFFFILGIFLFIFLSDPKKKDKRGPINVKELFKIIQNNVKNIFSIIYFLAIPGVFLGFFLYLHISYFIIAFLFSLFSLFLYFFSKKIDYISSKKSLYITSKYIGVLSSYITIIFTILYYYKSNFDIFIYFLLGYGIIFNFYIHFKFKNYVSLGFGIISILFLIYELYNTGG